MCIIRTLQSANPVLPEFRQNLAETSCPWAISLDYTSSGRQYGQLTVPQRSLSHRALIKRSSSDPFSVFISQQLFAPSPSAYPHISVGQLIHHTPPHLGSTHRSFCLPFLFTTTSRSANLSPHTPSAPPHKTHSLLQNNNFEEWTKLRSMTPRVFTATKSRSLWT